jgi:hypothetical protein
VTVLLRAVTGSPLEPEKSRAARAGLLHARNSSSAASFVQTKFKKGPRQLPTPLDGVAVLFSHGEMATAHQFELPYMVEQWDDDDRHVEELLALTGDYRVARAAFEEAVKRRPGRNVTLPQKTRLLRTAGGTTRPPVEV